MESWEVEQTISNRFDFLEWLGCGGFVLAVFVSCDGSNIEL